MKKITTLLTMIVLITVAHAQSAADKINGGANKVSNASNSIYHTSTAIDSTSSAVSNLTNTIGGIFKKKKKDAGTQSTQSSDNTNAPAVQPSVVNTPNTIVISLAGVDYATLKCAKDSIKAIRGIQSVNMAYSTTGSTLNVVYNGNAGELWDALSPKVSSVYNIISLNDNTINAEFKKQ